MEVEGDSFSINRFAQGLLGDFLRAVSGRAARAVIWLIKQLRSRREARRSTGLVLRVIYVLPGARTQARDSAG